MAKILTILPLYLLAIHIKPIPAPNKANINEVVGKQQKIIEASEKQNAILEARQAGPVSKITFVLKFSE